MILLGAFFGNEFNQNGDLANLEVIARAFVSESTEVAVATDVRDFNELVNLDFLVIGDCSKAHMRNRINELTDLPRVIDQRVKLGKWTLIVGNSYEFLSAAIFDLQPIERESPISGFFSHNFGGLNYWGYINTKVQLPPVVVKKYLVGTQFFGPLLARNPLLITQIAVDLGVQTDRTFIDDLDSTMRRSPNFQEARNHRI